MGDVIEWQGNTTVDIPVETVCEGAKTCTEVLIIGTNSEGKPFFASSTADKYRLLWLVERFKAKLVWGDFT